CRRISYPFNHNVQKGLDLFLHFTLQRHIEALHTTAVNTFAQRPIGHSRQHDCRKARRDHYGQRAYKKGSGSEIKTRLQPDRGQYFSGQNELDEEGGDAQPAVIRAEKNRESPYRRIRLFSRRLELKVYQSRYDD